MEFHILNSYGADLHFPVPFSEYNIKQGTSNKTIELLNFGEITWFGNKKLKECNLSGFFPRQQYNFCQCDIWDMQDYINFIQEIIDQKQICRFIITGTDINFSCTIENFEYGENDGSGDVTFNISIKEYRSVW